jgi:hypothetical protein
VWSVERVSGVVVGTLRSSDRVLNMLGAPILLRFWRAAASDTVQLRVAPGDVWHVPVTTQASYSLTLRPEEGAGQAALDWASCEPGRAGVVTVSGQVTTHAWAPRASVVCVFVFPDVAGTLWWAVLQCCCWRVGVGEGGKGWDPGLRMPQCPWVHESLCAACVLAWACVH